MASRSGTWSRAELSFVGRTITICVHAVSPPPYMNGGVEFLSWVIESTDSDFSPGKCAEWLEGRLPRPVDNLEKWAMDDD